MFEITSGIKITVHTEYQAQHSDVLELRFSFVYKIIIENHNHFPVQLLSRKWRIFESNGSCRFVEGDGVVGQQPIIEPTESHQYVSGCVLQSDMGRMGGVYIMKNLISNELFEVTIPNFDLIIPAKNN